MMKRYLLLVLMFCLSINALIAQEDTTEYIEYGVELQQYPTGTMPGLRVEWRKTPHHSIDLRVGMNILYHGDLGVHESENGYGFGFTPGYRYYFSKKNRHFFLGARSDIWFNEVNWKDNIGTPQEISGQTNIVVLQPTAIVGCTFLVQKKWAIAPTFAAGYEVNVIQKGEPVGEGMIMLIGINAGCRF